MTAQLLVELTLLFLQGQVTIFPPHSWNACHTRLKRWRAVRTMTPASINQRCRNFKGSGPASGGILPLLFVEFPPETQGLPGIKSRRAAPRLHRLQFRLQPLHSRIAGASRPRAEAEVRQ